MASNVPEDIAGVPELKNQLWLQYYSARDRFSGNLGPMPLTDSARWVKAALGPEKGWKWTVAYQKAADKAAAAPVIPPVIPPVVRPRDVIESLDPAARSVLERIRADAAAERSSAIAAREAAAVAAAEAALASARIVDDDAKHDGIDDNEDVFGDLPPIAPDVEAAVDAEAAADAEARVTAAALAAMARMTAAAKEARAEAARHALLVSVAAAAKDAAEARARATVARAAVVAGEEREWSIGGGESDDSNATIRYDEEPATKKKATKKTAAKKTATKKKTRKRKKGNRLTGTSDVSAESSDEY